MRPRGWPQTSEPRICQGQSHDRWWGAANVLLRLLRGLSWQPEWMRSLASVGTVTLWSRFYYYLFTYGNNVGSISPTINLQTWLLNRELCNTWTKRKKTMAANQHDCAQDIYNHPRFPGRLLHCRTGRKHMEICKHTSWLEQFSAGPLD